MEVLSAGATDGRVHFAIPVALELRRQPFRVYGSAGYFTRGAVFSGGTRRMGGAAPVDCERHPHAVAIDQEPTRRSTAWPCRVSAPT